MRDHKYPSMTYVECLLLVLSVYYLKVIYKLCRQLALQMTFTAIFLFCLLAINLFVRLGLPIFHAYMQGVSDISLYLVGLNKMVVCIYLTYTEFNIIIENR